MHPSLTWLVNSLVLLTVLCILWNLGAALFALLFDRGGASDRMLRALLRRMVLSVLLFAALLGATAMGWIVPKMAFLY